MSRETHDVPSSYMYLKQLGLPTRMEGGCLTNTSPYLPFCGDGEQEVNRKVTEVFASDQKVIAE